MTRPLCLQGPPLVHIYHRSTISRALRDNHGHRRPTHVTRPDAEGALFEFHRCLPCFIRDLFDSPSLTLNHAFRARNASPLRYTTLPNWFLSLVNIDPLDGRQNVKLFFGQLVLE